MSLRVMRDRTVDRAWVIGLILTILGMEDTARSAPGDGPPGVIGCVLTIQMRGRRLRGGRSRQLPHGWARTGGAG